MDVTWEIIELNATDIVLRINDNLVTPFQVQSMAGQSFELQCGPNIIAFEDMVFSVKLTLNQKVSRILSGKLHIDITNHAVCIGESCMMWPPNTKSNNPTSDILDTKKSWDMMLTNKGIIIVDCFANWCEPCKRIAPKFIEFKEKYTSFTFCSVNIEINTYVYNIYSITQLPTFLFIKDGVEIDRIIGSDMTILENRIKMFESNNDIATIQFQPMNVVSAKDKSHYNYIVIGGGSGGLASAKEAAKHGARVALFDYVNPSTQNTRWGFGGTCVNVGCIPKKLMHHAALKGKDLPNAKKYGWDVSSDKFHDWDQLVSMIQTHIKKLNFFYQNGLKTATESVMLDGSTKKIGNGSITYHNAYASFLSPNKISWKNDYDSSGEITGDHILIAVGTRPHVPSDIPGLREYAITSDDLFSRRQPPGKVLCIGAGYISLECSGFLCGLGYDVTVMVRSAPLRSGNFDRQCVQKVIDWMTLEGVKFIYGTVTSVVKQIDGSLQVMMGDKMDVFDTVICATGRSANIKGLHLELAGVNVIDKILTNEYDQTNMKHIYAIGDVAQARPELTPVAIKAGQYLARRLFARGSEVMNYAKIPTTVFTPVEYGLCGLSEESAISKYGTENVEVFLSEFCSLELIAAYPNMKPNVLSKLVCNKITNEVVGFHYVGPNAGEITQGFALAINMNATKDDFDKLIGIHPTDAESFTLLDITKSSNIQWITSGGCGGGKCG